MTARLLASNLLKARTRRKIKQEGLSLTVGCSRSYISKLEQGLILPSAALALKLEKALGVKSGLFVKVLAVIKRRETLLRDQARRAVRDARVGQSESLRNDYVLVPLYAATRTWTDDIDKYIAIPKTEMDGHKLFCLRVHDDSMDGAGIRKGNVILVEAKDAKDGDICVYCVGKICFIRRCRKNKNGLRMSPDSSSGTHAAADFGPGSRLHMKGIMKRVYLDGSKNGK
jgi:transcriptional regulator with XRE-family HTH domain